MLQRSEANLPPVNRYEPIEDRSFKVATVIAIALASGACALQDPVPAQDYGQAFASVQGKVSIESESAERASFSSSLSRQFTHKS